MNGESYYTVDSLIDNGWSEDLFLKQLCFSCITGSSKRPFPFDQEFSVDAYCVALVTNGSARITIDMRAVELQDGCVVLLSPTSVLRIESIDTVFAAMALIFSRTWCERIANYSRYVETQNRTDTICWHPGPIFLEQLRHTLQLFSSYTAGHYSYREGLMVMLSNFLLLQLSDELDKRLPSGPRPIDHRDNLLQQFLALLAQHHQEHHEVRFYADALCVSPAYLSRVVREKTGHTVYHYISERLFLTARHLLACSDMSLSEITRQLHFSDQSAFGKFFKMRSGLSPTQYRRKVGR